MVVVRAEQGVKVAGWDPNGFWGVGVRWGVGHCHYEMEKIIEVSRTHQQYLVFYFRMLLIKNCYGVGY